MRLRLNSSISSQLNNSMFMYVYSNKNSPASHTTCTSFQISTDSMCLNCAQQDINSKIVHSTVQLVQSLWPTNTGSLMKYLICIIMRGLLRVSADNQLQRAYVCSSFASI